MSGIADAATRAADLIVEVAGGRVDPGIGDVRDGEREWRLAGSIELARLDRFAGVEIPPAESRRILQGLGYEPREVEEEEAEVEEAAMDL